MATSNFITHTVPSGSPQNFEATVLSSTMVTLSWEPPNESDRNGVITGYIINLMAEDGTSLDELLVQASVLSYTFEELNPFTNYSLTTAASTSVGPGPTSILWITTQEDGK